MLPPLKLTFPCTFSSASIIFARVSTVKSILTAASTALSPFSTFRKTQVDNGRNSLQFDVPLTTGKSGKLKQTREASLPLLKGLGESFDLRVSAYGISQSIDLSKLSTTTYPDDGYHCLKLPSDVCSEVFFVSKANLSDKYKHRDILVFRTGVVVLWNVPEDECSKLLTSLHQYCDSPVSSGLIECEDLRYKFTTEQSSLDGEDILLQQVPQDPEENISNNSSYDESNCPRLVFEKIAFSDALALSVKLSLLEASFDSVAVQMQPWIDKMKTGLGAFFSQSVVFRKTGELFTLRHLLNVSTNIIETPDFYWDRPDAEKLFQKLKAILCVHSRTKILNSKLDTCCELTEILTNHLQARHASRLEWMIIALIVVEVIFEFHHLYNDLMSNKKISPSES